MHYLLSLLLIFSFTFAQKTKIHYIDDDSSNVMLKGFVEDGTVLYKITTGGETQEFEIDLDDDEALAKMQEKIDLYALEDDDTKVRIVKKLKKHDCKKLSCDPNTCDHKKIKDCSKDAMILHMKDDGSHKKHKIIKKHKMMDKSFFSGEKAGFLGIQLQDLSEQLSDHFKVKDGNGVLISEVVKDSPAEKAGLKAGDIIIKVDDDVIENAGDLRSVIRSYKPEEKVSISVIRDGKKKKLNATLGETEQEYFHNFGNFEGFEFPEFQFDQQEFEEKMEEMQEQLQELKLELKELREE